MSADLLDRTLRELLERVLVAPAAAEADPWLDTREQPFAPHRELTAAAKREEIALYRVSRRTVVRRSELDRWIQLPAHRVTAATESEQEAPSGVEHILQRHGFRKAAAR